MRTKTLLSGLLAMALTALAGRADATNPLPTGGFEDTMLPSFGLLDALDLNAIAEPASLILMLAALAGTIVFTRRDPESENRDRP